MPAATAMAHRVASQSLGLGLIQVAWVCFAVGAAATYLLVFPRAAGLVPVGALAVGFVFFHVGLAASALVRGGRRGWLAALASNGVPVAVFWLAVLSVPAFLARFS
jgi:hypothetical protein